MLIPYDEIISSFLGKMTDVSYVNISEYELTNLSEERMKSVVSDPYVRRVFSSITFDAELGVINAVMREQIDEFADYDFTVELFARGMVIKWLEPIVKSTDKINQYFSNSDQKFYSQAQHLSEVKGLLKNEKRDLRAFIRDRGYTKGLINEV